MQTKRLSGASSFRFIIQIIILPEELKEYIEKETGRDRLRAMFTIRYYIIILVFI